MLDKLALVLVIIGALNWGSIGLFQFDIVAWLFGGPAAIISRIVYTPVSYTHLDVYKRQGQGVTIDDARIDILREMGV